MNTTAPFASISPTALNLVHYRSHSGIPYAAQIAAFTNATQKVSDFMGPEAVTPLAMERLGDWAELRHRALDAAIGNDLNIVEFAAGFSPRGLIATKKDPRVYYVAIDLPGTFVERVSLMGLFGIPENLYLVSADATNPDEVVAAAECLLGEESLSVISEGLFLYLTHEQKFDVMRSAQRLLNRMGDCVWFTADVHTKAEFARISALSPIDMKRFDQNVGRRTMENCFDSLDEAEALFEKAGFRVDRHEQLDFVSAKDLHQQSPDPAVKAMLEEQHLWALRPR